MVSIEPTSYEINQFNKHHHDLPTTKHNTNHIRTPTSNQNPSIYDDFEEKTVYDDFDENNEDVDYEVDPLTPKRTPYKIRWPENQNNNNNNPAVKIQLPHKHVSQEKLRSSYKASNAPVILDGWNRTVQVHLIVDLTSSVEVDPASKLLLAGVERSKYTQLKALTFVRPQVQTFEMFPRDANLPLLFLIDWGSMDRDCHRLQLVLEEIRAETEMKEEEPEQPYFLLIDSSGSTRQSGCGYLFENIGGDDIYAYANTNDHNRIRLAKRSIVQNRYYDRSTKTIITGNFAPNQWSETPSDYHQPVLQFPFSLRESFVMGIQNITSGFQIVPPKDKMRPVDVGYFWKSGDYSHYGFYRKDIAKVVKTLHHSSLNKNKGTVMENTVEIAYDDAKDMEAGHVQVKYLEKLLSCKIVVVTQRDEWEDHYRLMESLASGALVMTDSMMALPEGFVNGKNIVVYDSPKHLKELIRYYLKSANKAERLEIATNGYKLAMGRHRCWHRLEEVLFGKPLTNFNKPNDPAPPKELPPDYRRK